MTVEIKISQLPTASLPLQGTEQVIIIQNGVTCRTPVNSLWVLKSYLKASLPTASQPGQMIYVTDEVGGAVPAFSDGSSWRRITDRAVVS